MGQLGQLGQRATSDRPPAVRDLYSSLPETSHLEPWELQHVLFSLGYVDDLADEAEIAAAVELARSDWLEWRAA